MYKTFMTFQDTMNLTRGFSFQDVTLPSRPQWPCQAPDKKWASVNSLTLGGENEKTTTNKNIFEPHMK